MDCLLCNQDSAWGLRYGFSSVGSVEEYQNRVPVVDYETLVPWIEKMANGEQALLTGIPVVAFEKTGGSHSGGKLIPYTSRGLSDFRRELIGWLGSLIEQFQLHEGKAYWALSPAMAEPEITRSGIPVGAGDAVYLGEENLEAFARLSAVPFSLAAVADIDHWQLLTLYFLVCCPDLRLISVWSPSFLTSLLTALHEKQSTLLAILAEGGAVAGHELRANSDALCRFQQYLTEQNTRLLWPELAVVSCWADASSQPLAMALSQQFPGVHIQPKGLLSTEAIITVPDKNGKARLCLDSNFYEFLSDDGDICLSHEVTPGDEYRVIVTTNNGLYRYQTGDRVCCMSASPDEVVLSFIGRSGVCSDLVGEKLSEPFVNHCLSKLKGFAALAPDSNSSGYVLLLDDAYRQQNESLLASIEQHLCSNPQYAYARRLTQLAPIHHQFIHQPVEQYLRWQYDKGKSPGDIKLPALFSNDSWRGVFS